MSRPLGVLTMDWLLVALLFGAFALLFGLVWLVSHV